MIERGKSAKILCSERRDQLHAKLMALGQPARDREGSDRGLENATIAPGRMDKNDARTSRKK